MKNIFFSIYAATTTSRRDGVCQVSTPSLRWMNKARFLILCALCCVPFTARAADQTVNISSYTTASTISAAIQNAINNTGGSGIVTVTGSVSGINTGGVVISTPSAVEICWQANISGSTVAPLVEVIANGNSRYFTIEGGIITNTGTGRGVVTNGLLRGGSGTVSSNSGVAIIAGGWIALYGNIVVSTTNGTAVYTTAATGSGSVCQGSKTTSTPYS